MARVLGRIRLSRSTDESTSEDRQRELIESWARSNDHTIVGWAVDMTVSGSISPFDAPALGPWLAEGKRDGWDVLVAWKMDRLGRGLFDLNALFAWCSSHGKALICTADPVDITSPLGRLLAVIVAGIAEMELEAIRTRTQASHEELRRRGRFSGGTVPMGYRMVRRDGGAWLEVNEDEAVIVRDMANRAVRRESIRSIATRLNDAGLAARRGGAWTPQSVTRILRSRWIIGQAEHDGKTVIDESTGLPQQRAEPLISTSLWQEVQDVMNDSSRPKIRNHETGLLLNVASCAECWSPLWLNVMVKPATEQRAAQSYRYWRCSGKTAKRNGCKAPSVRAEKLEAYAETELLRQIGDVERTERVFIAAEGYGEQIEQVTRAIETVRQEKDLGLYDGDDAGYFARLTMLTQRRKDLAAMPNTPARWERRGLGETYGDAWLRMNGTERRELMLDAGVSLSAGPAGFSFTVPVQALEAGVPGFEGPDYSERPGMVLDAAGNATWTL